MAKFPRHPKMDKIQAQDLVIGLCDAIASTKNSQEAAQLLTDLLGKQELEMLARRLKVAEMLLGDFKYQDIQKFLKISTTTIARVQTWLQNSGDGYRTVIDRTAKKRILTKTENNPLGFAAIKKKYPIYFWPQILLEQWAQNSSRQEKDRMIKILAKIQDKPKIYREIEILLK